MGLVDRRVWHGGNIAGGNSARQTNAAIWFTWLDSRDLGGLLCHTGSHLACTLSHGNGDHPPASICPGSTMGLPETRFLLGGCYTTGDVLNDDRQPGRNVNFRDQPFSYEGIVFAIAGFISNMALFIEALRSLNQPAIGAW